MEALNRSKCRWLFLAVVAIATMAVFTATPVSAQQASITLTNCNNALCNANDTAWTLAKEPNTQSLTGDNTITWTVTATKVAPTDNFITVNGLITVKNTGTAPATIGNIVVNLQKPRTGPNTSPCRNVPWVSAAADVATAYGNGTPGSSDAAILANIVAAASTEVVACNAAQGGPVGGPPASNYTTPTAAEGTFVETAGSGSLEFTDADSNTVFSLTPEVSLAPNQSITLLYSAKFNNTILQLPVGSQVRSEVIVTFGNSGRRGGSGSSATDIDIDGDGIIDVTGDEHLVRSVPCRVTNAIPTLVNGNSTVTLSDTSDDVSVTGTGVAVSNFSTDIGSGVVGQFDGDGDEDISATAVRSVNVDETCTPPGSATVHNDAHLDGASSTVTVLGPIDPVTQLPVEFTFVCVKGVALDDGANAEVACEVPPPVLQNACTYSKGGYAGPGAPGAIFDAKYSTTFSSGLTIGIEDGLGSKHDATWAATATGQSNLKTYLTSAASGPNTALTADTDNTTSTSGGSLPRQTAALTLNIGFDAAGVLPNGDQGLDTLKLCNLVDGSVISSAFTLNATQATALNGQSVAGVLAAANDALGGNGLPSYVGSFGDLNQLVETLNLSFHECVASAFALANLCSP